jgi:type IV pilus assembly protein PilM
MPFGKHNRPVALGLDVGTKTVKAVRLRLVDRRPELLGVGRLTLSAEGILDDQELRESIADWVQRSGWRRSDTCTGLPQYLTTVQVRDFPVAPPGGMGKMIDFETRHLSGISEERFLTDYQILPPGAGRRNPVLIGVCRESVVAERLSLIEAAGLLPADLTMNSLAGLNALFDLHPETLREKRPQLLLDVGADSSTVTLFAEGHPLFSGSLMIGGERFTQELAAVRNLSPAQADEAKGRSPIELDRESAPLSRVAHNLQVELNGVLEQWRGQESAELRDQPLAGLWLCGGGARQAGLAESLAAEYRCPAAVFGPQTEPGKNPEPDLAVAYGLALQGIGKAPVSVSLTPFALQWSNTRRRNFPALVAAAVFLAALLVILMSGYYRELRSVDARQRAEIARLDRCSKLIPEIEQRVEAIRHHERLMLPLVVKGNNAGRFLAAAREIAAATGDNAFFVYLADEAAFHAVAAPEAATAAKAQLPWATATASEADDRTREYGILVPRDTLTEPTRLILGGYTFCAGKREHYELVRAIQQKLDDSYLFGSSGEKVDIVPENDTLERIPIFSVWSGRLVNNPLLHQYFRRDRLRQFVLRLPFSERNIHPEVVAP